jgi:hypothetical protein
MARRNSDEQQVPAADSVEEAPGTEQVEGEQPETEVETEAEPTEPEVETEDEGVEPESEDEAEAEDKVEGTGDEAEVDVTEDLEALLAAAAVEQPQPVKEKRPQMYIYARNGRFKIRRSPVDIQRRREGKTKAVPRWEIFPLSTFQTFVEEYVTNQKKGITAAQARKAAQQSAAASDAAAEQGLTTALEESLARVGGGDQTEAE